ncbi:MAG: tetratricopeptide repeat protein, partial [Bryobacteraceae bacterium]
MVARAVLVLLAAFSTTPATPPSPCGVGMAQMKRGDYASAQQLLWQCVLSGPSKQTEGFYLGLTYRELKNYDDGLAKSAAALKQSPENVDLLYLAAFLHYRKNETKESMTLLSRAYHIAPNDWRIHQLFALNYALFLMPSAVEMELKTAIRLNPNNAELHYQLGRFYFSEQHFQKSIDEINRAIVIAPDYPKAYDSLGLA